MGIRPFMLFGTAIAQPPSPAAPGHRTAAAAVVASRDRSLGRYSSRVLLQPPGGTVIGGLAAAARELLVDFYRVNGSRKPEALLVYRSWGWSNPVSGGSSGSGGCSGSSGARQWEAEAEARQAAVAAEYEALRKVGFLSGGGGTCTYNSTFIWKGAERIRCGVFHTCAACCMPLPPSPLQACFDLEEGYCPPITFVLVSKKHPT